MFINGKSYENGWFGIDLGVTPFKRKPPFPLGKKIDDWIWLNLTTTNAVWSEKTCYFTDRTEDLWIINVDFGTQNWDWNYDQQDRRAKVCGVWLARATWILTYHLCTKCQQETTCRVSNSVGNLKASNPVQERIVPAKASGLPEMMAWRSLWTITIIIDYIDSR